MISDNPNVSLEIVVFLLHTHRFGLKDDYHKKNGYAFVYSCRVQLLGKSCKDFCSSCQKN